MEGVVVYSSYSVTWLQHSLTNCDLIKLLLGETTVVGGLISHHLTRGVSAVFCP